MQRKSDRVLVATYIAVCTALAVGGALIQKQTEPEPEEAGSAIPNEGSAAGDEPADLGDRVERVWRAVREETSSDRTDQGVGDAPSARAEEYGGSL